MFAEFVEEMDWFVSFVSSFFFFFHFILNGPFHVLHDEIHHRTAAAHPRQLRPEPEPLVPPGGPRRLASSSPRPREAFVPRLPPVDRGHRRHLRR